MTKKFTVTFQIINKKGKRIKEIKKQLGEKETDALKKEIDCEIEKEIQKENEKEKIRDLFNPSGKKSASYDILGYDGPVEISNFFDYLEINQELLQINYKEGNHDILFETLGKNEEFDFFEIINCSKKSYEIYKTKTKDPKLEVTKKIMKKNPTTKKTLKEYKDFLFNYHCYLNEETGIVIYLP